MRLDIPCEYSYCFKEVVRDADKYYTWWAQRPIVIPAYNYLGRDLNEEQRLTWTEDGVKEHLFREIKESCKPAAFHL